MKRPVSIAPLCLALGLGLAPVVPASACPDPAAVPAARHAVTGRALWSPEVYPVRAGGDVALRVCGLSGWGHVRRAPDFRFELSRMTRYDRLHLRVNAECDPVLLVRDPAGRWHFDDDSGTGRTASLSLAEPADGRYDVWVGSFATLGCVARLTLETF